MQRKALFTAYTVRTAFAAKLRKFAGREAAVEYNQGCGAWNKWPFEAARGPAWPGASTLLVFGA